MEVGIVVETADKRGYLGLGGESSLGWGERFARFPWSLFAMLIILASVGFVVLYSATGGGDNLPLLWRQMARFGVGLFIMISLGVVGGEKLYRRYAYVFYGISLSLLVAVFFMGTMGMGARRWLSIGGFLLQPSELMKVALVLALARYFHDRAALMRFDSGGVAVPLLMIAVPAIFIMKQPDLGTAIMVISVGVTVMVVSGLSWTLIIGSLVVFGASVPVAWNYLYDYQRQRILTLFFPEQDPLGAGYHIIQSKIAIGSGGVFGKGFMVGSQSRLEFLPERHTDFIFSVLAEEWGFFGGVALLLLYGIIIIRTLIIANRASDRFGLLVGVGMTSFFAFQVLVNIGMVIGLLPVVGIPLPFISYGGSSMLTLMMAMGFLCHVSLYSKQHGRSV
ncbi:MAG: rod shape-determining protein RodA [Magnetococcales bacterium]|nr:rod shape-determining protein RodA [Magnetococcales bacterium]